MTILRATLVAAFVIVGLAGAARAQTKPQGEMQMGGHDKMPMAMPAAAGMKGGTDAAFMESMRKMDQAMSTPMSGNTDRDFVTMMIAHHQGAVDMAQIELDHGRDPMLKRLARNVIAAQTREIALMTRWLAKNPG